jgi:hypothetical protein
MSAVLSEAETKFFSSRGADVDPSLQAAPVEPPKPVDAVTTPPPAAAPPPPAATAAEPPAPAPQHVPLAALHEERKARQKAEQERQQLQQQLQQFQEQLQKAQQPPPPPPPDPNQDPIGAVLHQNQLLQQELNQLKGWRTEQDQFTQQIVARNQFNQAITNSEQAFAQKQPDYWQAAKYATAQYDKLLSALIPDPAQRQQRVIQEAMGAAYTVMQEGKDPAEFFYSFAKSMGYAPSTGVTPSAGGGSVPATPAIAQTVPDVVKTIEKGLKQQANPGGGASPSGEITPEMALTLPGEDFNKWWAKQFRR